ncbi:MAG: GGDEF domain-containing protein [Allorhizobium sp.]
MLVLAAEALTLAALIFAVWLHDRSKRHFASWAAGFAVRGAGVALFALRGSIPDVLSVGLANGLALTALSFWIAGLRQLGRQGVAWWIVIPPAIWAIGMLFPDVSGDLLLRSPLYALAVFVGYGMLAFASLSGNFGSWRYRALFAATWLLLGVNTVAVAICIIIERPANVLDVSIGPIAGIVAISGFFLILLLGAKILMEESEKRLQHLVRSDPLTGILNRRGLIEAFSGLRRTGSGKRPIIALMLFDLDHFKQVNDTHGHEAGDRVLVSFSKLVCDADMTSAIFGRTGGEEFAVIARVGDIREAGMFAERIRRSVGETSMGRAGTPITLTVSIGIAAMPGGQADLDELMRGADHALYAAKADGRNRTALFQDGVAIIVPADDHIDHAQVRALNDQADRQVAVLRRVVNMDIKGAKSS